MKKIDRIVNNLREMLVANTPGESGGLSTSAVPKGPVAGFDPLIGFSRRRKAPDLFDMRTIPKKYRRWIV
jgi:hypothetical protein